MPSASAATFLSIVGAGVGAIAAMSTPRTRVGQLTAVLAWLMTGQLAAHVALAVGDPHGAMHAHSIVPSGRMLGMHLVASAVTAVLVSVAEALYAVITSIVRVTAGPAVPLPARRPGVIDAPTVGHRVHLFATSISRRGPPVSA